MFLSPCRTCFIDDEVVGQAVQGILNYTCYLWLAWISYCNLLCARLLFAPVSFGAPIRILIWRKTGLSSLSQPPSSWSFLRLSNLQFSGVVRHAQTSPTREGDNKLLNMSAAAAGSPNMEVKGVSKEMALLSNILAAYTFIAGESPNASVYNVWVRFPHFLPVLLLS